MRNYTIKHFEDSLKNYIEDYYNGDCDLERVISAVENLKSFKANVGINAARLPHNNREQAFHDQWLQENAPLPGINYGHGILQDLFIEQGKNFFGRNVVVVINDRDRMIVATVIQRLGSNVGMSFLSAALSRFGMKMVDKPEH